MAKKTSKSAKLSNMTCETAAKCLKIYLIFNVYYYLSVIDRVIYLYRFFFVFKCLNILFMLCVLCAKCVCVCEIFVFLYRD